MDMIHLTTPLLSDEEKTYLYHTNHTFTSTFINTYLCSVIKVLISINEDQGYKYL